MYAMMEKRVVQTVINVATQLVANHGNADNMVMGVVAKYYKLKLVNL